MTAIIGEILVSAMALPSHKAQHSDSRAVAAIVVVVVDDVVVVDLVDLVVVVVVVVVLDQGISCVSARIRKAGLGLCHQRHGGS
jgi:hypothetical protein